MVAEVSNMCHANSLRNMMRGQIVPRQTSRWSQSPGGAIFLLSGEVGRSHQPVVMDIYIYVIWPIYGPYMAHLWHLLRPKPPWSCFQRHRFSPGSSCLYGGTSQLHRTAGQEIRSLWTEMAILWTFSWVLFHPFPCINIFGSSQTLPKYTWQIWQFYNIYYI